LLVCWSDKEMLRQSRITFPCKFKCSFENVMSILTFIHGASPVRFRVCFCVRFGFDFFRVVLACVVGAEKMRKWRRIDHHSVGFRRWPELNNNIQQKSSPIVKRPPTNFDKATCVIGETVLLLQETFTLTKGTMFCNVNI
jgi:hypothetical protein